MNIFKTVRSSIYNPTFYSAKVTEPMSKGFRYFFTFLLIVVLFQTILIGVIAIPALRLLISDEARTQLVSAFPSELAITIEKGQASTNVEEPYVIPMRQLIPSWTGTPEHVLVIDTKTPVTLDRFAEYKTAALLTKNALIVRKDNGPALDVQPLSSLPDVTIDRARITGWADSISRITPWVAPLLLVGLYILLFVITAVSNLIILSLFTLMAWVIERIKKTSLTYGQLFHLGLYAITLPILLNIILMVMGLPLSWYLYGLVYLLALYINLRTERHA